MKILFYNWTPLNVQNQGGGVAVYLKKMMKYLSMHNYDVDIYFLSSGYFYDSKKRVHIVKEESEFAHSYIIINSPIIAPLGNVPYKDFQKIICDNEIVTIFDRFIKEYGPFDVIHFHSFEGLSPNVLSLKEKYRNTKFIHSMHDYGCFCPNVKFWTLADTNCVSITNKNCYKCNKGALGLPFYARIKFRQQISVYEKLFYRILNRMMIVFSNIRSKDSCIKRSLIYQKYRDLCVTRLNKYIDAELSVSRTVKEIALSYGVNEQKTHVCYIGTEAAETFCRQSSSLFDGKTLEIIYLGYVTKAKGTFLLLDALESMDTLLANNIIIKFACKIQDKSVFNRIVNLRSKFKDVIVYDGYTHADYPRIFKGVNLGIVPPLWEDNLPQVALEMIGNGIPVITSNHGGAKELNSHPDFCFKDVPDLINKIRKIYKNPMLLNEYWQYATDLTTMKKHIEQLFHYYTL